MSDLIQRIASLSNKQRAVLARQLGLGESGKSERDGREPIAIIGLACRVPGASNPEAFWTLLHHGIDAITEVPPERWNIDDYYDPDMKAPGKMSTRWGGFLEGIDRFDAYFFGISPQEAVRMDPQQRQLAELTYEVLEDAGQPLERLAGSRTGLFLGISAADYGVLQLDDPRLSDAFVGTGNAPSIAANRLSYLFDFRGPSLSLDTACSSSLVTVHLACQSLWTGESTLALAGGVNLLLHPTTTVNFTKAGFMAPDGRCKPFDARANGYVRSEGIGLVALKPLAQALADGDPIRAVIRGSAVNQDGRSNGLTAPNGKAQEEVLREAYARAGLSPALVQYVEAHGTGTSLGDPIEILALAKVVGEDRPGDHPCPVGSVKSNIGHLEAAAGIASLIKVVLALEHRTLPPSLHFDKPNPHIPFERLPLVVQRERAPWPSDNRPRLAGVSSFGFGGTNAHVVVEEAPATSPPARQANSQPLLLPLSARGTDALQARARAFKGYLEQLDADQEPDFADICYTASVRRSHHDDRLAVLASSAAEASDQLRAFLAGEEQPGLASGRKVPGRGSRVAFVFSGQGPQWWGMGRQLLESAGLVRATLEQCATLLSRYVSWSLLEELQAPEEQSRIPQTAYAQPALVALQVALANLWRSWGIEPYALVGHSVGELAAAHLCGALELEDALRIAAKRGQLMEQLEGRGRTASVELPADALRAGLTPCSGRVTVAAVNSPSSSTVSGEPEAVEELVQSLQRQGILATLLRVHCAFHSPQADPLQPQLVSALQGLQPRTAQIPFFSTVTGQLTPGEKLDAAYWGRNLRQPVLFASAIQGMLQQHCNLFLEIGPHPVLATALTQCLHDAKRQGVVLPSLRRGEADRSVLLRSLGTLYVRGLDIAWEKVSDPGRCVRLPAYPWQRERYWMERTAKAPGEASSNGVASLLSSRPGRLTQLAYPFGQWVWETELDPASFAGGNGEAAGPVPDSIYLELALAGMEAVPGAKPYALSQVHFRAPLFLNTPDVLAVQVILGHSAEGEVPFDVYTRPRGKVNESWTLRATGRADASSPPNAPGADAFPPGADAFPPGADAFPPGADAPGY
jgi:acyl transferase domain-containing protein